MAGRTFAAIILTIVLSKGFGQTSDFKVLAFYNNKSDVDSKSLRSFLSKNFDVEESTDLNRTLDNYKVIVFVNDFPKTKKEQAAFQKYMESGGGWIGLQKCSFTQRAQRERHAKNAKENDVEWSWFAEFVGTKSFTANKPALIARLAVDKTHPAMLNIPQYITAPANEWPQWNPSPRSSKDIQVLVTLDPSNYPLGIDEILTGGDAPIVWTNTKFNMMYLNLGVDDAAMNDWLQERMIADALIWVAKKSVQKRKEIVSDMTDLPEMIRVEGATFTMGTDAGDRDEKPAHRVTVAGFSIAKTETTMAQWRKFCKATGRSMPEEPWFQQSEQHPVVNVSWDHATAYCQWLSDVTGKHYRLPTEAEWEFAAKGGVKSKGFPYSGGNVPDSVAWLGRKTEGTMPVGTKAPNELGLYDMTGNVWEWCSDWYAVDYYPNSEKENPKGPSTGQFYTFRGGAWDIGLRNNRVSYRNPLAPMSRNHNKGFRVVCDCD